jgi:regulator of protease activity HflC (stomatin/prohibitin superfamily)
MTAPEIQQEIERTRERLGETVDELAAKTDVKARTQAKAAEMKAKAQGKAIEMKAKAQGKATEMKAKAQGKATEMKSKATEVSGQVRRSQVVQRRWPVAAAAASIVLVGSLLAWRRRKT